VGRSNSGPRAVGAHLGRERPIVARELAEDTTPNPVGVEPIVVESPAVARMIAGQPMLRLMLKVPTEPVAASNPRPTHHPDRCFAIRSFFHFEKQQIERNNE